MALPSPPVFVRHPVGFSNGKLTLCCRLLLPSAWSCRLERRLRKAIPHCSRNHFARPSKSRRNRESPTCALHEPTLRAPPNGRLILPTRVTDHMKILLASTPATGHLNPLLAIGRLLIAEGHEVAFLSGSALRSPIERIGARFYAFPAGADFDLRDFATVAP